MKQIIQVIGDNDEETLYKMFKESNRPDMVRKSYRKLRFLETLPRNITVKLRAKEFKCNGYVLKMASEVLGAMLDSEMREGTSGEIQMNNVTYEVFSLFHRYAITGLLKPEIPSSMIALTRFAHQWGIQDLLDTCEKQLQLSIDRLSYRKDELKQLASTYSLKNLA